MTKVLQDDIRQKKPFRSLEQEAHLNIVRTAGELTADFELMLVPYGITASQYNVLRILRGAEPDQLCRNEIRERMITRMPDMTRLLDRLEAAGLVDRTRDVEDRRLVTTRITARGRDLLGQLEDVVADEHRQRLGHMSEKQLKTLIDLLGELREGT